jgi:subtilisin family serine protease
VRTEHSAHSQSYNMWIPLSRTSLLQINMSYGEPAARPDVGRVAEVASEAVNKAGIIFVASAGNAGEANRVDTVACVCPCDAEEFRAVAPVKLHGCVDTVCQRLICSH